MNDEPVLRLSLQVFDDDDPALVARLRALPKSKVRRREHLIRLLRLGVAAEAGEMLVSPTPQVLPQSRAAQAEPLSESVVFLPASATPQIQAAAARAFDTVIDPEDLAAVFGTPISSTA